MFTLWKKVRLPTKISIRASVLGLVLTLVIGISVLIITINYFALVAILIDSADNSLRYINRKASDEINEILDSLNEEIYSIINILNNDVIQPKPSDIFFEFLYNNIIRMNITGAYWGDTAGNWYGLNKEKNGSFSEQVIFDNGSRSITTAFDAQRRALCAVEAPWNTMDMRSRSWYQAAKVKKQLVWSTYQFRIFGSQKETMGLTVSFPLYNSKGDLLGVFGIDILLKTISDYLSRVKVTKNSAIFMVDSTGTLISMGGEEASKIFKSNVLPKFSSLAIPWLKKSIVVYGQNHKSPFIYSYDNKKYFASYEEILEAKADHPWFLAIVVPIDDVTAPLRKNVLITVMFSVIILIFGIIVASIFSSSLSNPIRKLARDASLICQLKLTEIETLFSRIKEISEMGEVFIKMRNVLQSFQLYMPVVLVKKLIASNKVAEVGGELKELTLVFTDIQNFTSLSENISPENLMQYLSQYFQIITSVIIEMGGTVDKYVGDEIIAFWGAPSDDLEHSLHACQTVLQIQKALKQLNEDWRVEHKPEIITRIGVNTGNVVVGNIGSGDRLNYTALGDPVNLASRLEGLNIVYGTSIIVSEFTYDKVKERFKFRLLDKVAVKGRKQGIYVYELLGAKIGEPDSKLEYYNSEFYKAFSLYENGDWQGAIDIFDILGKKYPEDTVIKLFINRCSTFIMNPPSNWHGVWNMSEK